MEQIHYADYLHSKRPRKIPAESVTFGPAPWARTALAKDGRSREAWLKRIAQNSREEWRRGRLGKHGADVGWYMRKGESAGTVAP